MKTAVTLNFEFSAADEAAAFLVSVHNLANGAAGNAVAQPAAGPATAKASAAPAPKAEKKATAAPSAETAPQDSTAVTTDQATAAFEGNGAAGSSEPETPAASNASSSEPIAYPVLQKEVFALAGMKGKVGREAALDVAKALGVANFKVYESDDKAADRAAALAAVKAKIAELEAA